MEVELYHAFGSRVGDRRGGEKVARVHAYDQRQEGRRDRPAGRAATAVVPLEVDDG